MCLLSFEHLWLSFLINKMFATDVNPSHHSHELEDARVKWEISDFDFEKVRGSMLIFSRLNHGLGLEDV